MIEIKASDKLKFSSAGVEFEVAPPSVYLYRDFQKRLTKAQQDEDGSSVDIMIEFCQSLGVPEDVLKQWSVAAMTQFFKHLSEEKKS
jgi:hypothetical protein